MALSLQGDPAVRRLPQNQAAGASANQRVAVVSTATQAVEAEHAEFQAAAAKITFQTKYTYKQVRSSFLLQHRTISARSDA